MNIFKKICERYLLWMLLVLTFIPFFIAILYCIPEADDFLFARHLIEYRAEYSNDFTASFAFGVHFYKIWQGAYFSNFTNIFFSPYVRGGITGYHIELIVLAVLFILAIIFLARMAMKNLCKGCDANCVALMSLLIFVGATIRSDLSEIFYWNCGSLAYLLPLTVGVLACAYAGFGKKKSGVLGWIELTFFSVMAFLSVGGTPTLSAGISGFMVLIVALKLYKSRKFDWSMIVATAAVVGSFVNAIAPGNFARQAGESGDITIKTALFYSVDYLVDKYYELFKNGSIIFIFAVLFLIVWKKLDIDKFKYDYPGFVTVWLLFVSFLGIFPVIYGHKSDYVADRSEFAESFIILIALIVISIYWIGWIKSKNVIKFSIEFKSILVAAVVCACALYCNTYTTDDFNCINIIRHYQSGDLQKYYEANMKLLNEIEFADTNNVVVEFVEPDDMGIYDNLHLSDNPYNWTNEAIAKFYGKETLSVIYCDPE